MQSGDRLQPGELGASGKRVEQEPFGPIHIQVIGVAHIGTITEELANVISSSDILGHESNLISIVEAYKEASTTRIAAIANQSAFGMILDIGLRQAQEYTRGDAYTQSIRAATNKNPTLLLVNIQDPIQLLHSNAESKVQQWSDKVRDYASLLNDGSPIDADEMHEEILFAGAAAGRESVLREQAMGKTVANSISQWAIDARAKQTSASSHPLKMIIVVGNEHAINLAAVIEKQRVLLTNATQRKSIIVDAPTTMNVYGSHGISDSFLSRTHELIREKGTRQLSVIEAVKLFENNGFTLIDTMRLVTYAAVMQKLKAIFLAESTELSLRQIADKYLSSSNLRELDGATRGFCNLIVDSLSDEEVERLFTSPTPSVTDVLRNRLTSSDRTRGREDEYQSIRDAFEHVKQELLA